MVLVVAQTEEFEQNGRKHLNYCLQRCDVLEPATAQDEQRIQNASAFFVLLDDGDTLEQMLEVLQDILSKFEENKPPVILLDTLAYKDALTTKGIVQLMKNLDDQTEEQQHLIESTFQKLGVMIEDPYVKIVSLTRHLECVKRSIYRELCDNWKSFAAETKLPDRGWRLPNAEPEEESCDPIATVLRKTFPYFLIRSTSNTCAFDDPFSAREEEEVVKTWDSAWEKIQELRDLHQFENFDQLLRHAERIGLFRSPIAENRSRLQEQRASTSLVADDRRLSPARCRNRHRDDDRVTSASNRRRLSAKMPPSQGRRHRSRSPPSPCRLRR